MTVIPFQPSMTKLLASILALKAIIFAGVVFYAGIGLGPDEAQYWTWSQFLDWGYYSKPPGIAWQIWLGTQLFGSTEWGIRSLSLFFSFIQAFAVYRLGIVCGLLTQTAFWCALFMAFCPLGLAGSLLAITDGGFLLCWTGACIAMASSLYQKKEPNPFVLGSCVMMGAFFKWPIYFFWVFVLLFRHWYFPHQKISSLLFGVLLSLGGLLPSLWWNISHDWATFRHVFATLQGGSGHPASGNPLEFLGSQALLLSPVLFILLLFALWHWLRKRNELPPPLFFCGFVTLLSLGIGVAASFFQKLQGNWIVFAYPTGSIILGWYCFQEQIKRSFLAKIGLASSIALTALTFSLPSFYLHSSLSSFAPPFRFNPFKHTMGGDMLRQALARNGHGKNTFLFSDKYQTTSLLSFYGEGKRRAYFLNLGGARNNQCSFWPTIRQEKLGESGYFVWIENQPRLEQNWKAVKEAYLEKLSAYFEKVEFLEVAPLVYEGSTVAKGAMIFRCTHCLDVQEPVSSLY